MPISPPVFSYYYHDKCTFMTVPARKQIVGTIQPKFYFYVFPIKLSTVIKITTKLMVYIAITKIRFAQVCRK